MSWETGKIVKITVAILEDDLHYNNALKKIIQFDKELQLAGQYFTLQQAIKEIRKSPVDILLADINLPDGSGIELVEMLKPELPNTEFLMCTNHENDDYIFNAIMAGAIGYLRKGESMELIIQSIKEGYNGGTPMSVGIARRALQLFRDTIHPKLDGDDQLTKTEVQILELLAQGKQYKEIAVQKNVTLETIRKHVSNIYKKLHVNNKVEAINKLSKARKI
jgi:NarL family two-component system response regulator LiaR